ncbi:MAG: ArnT family glycosyltransferase [Chthoniobacterales bacterium]
MSTTRAVWLFVLGLTAIRLTLVGTTDLSGDEAHYWMWSERLAPAYFSKGPGIAFVMRASTMLFGANEFGVRFFAPILGGATSMVLFYFARRVYSEQTALWAVLVTNATPIFNIGNLVMTIDPLSVFFWTAAMFTFWLAIERSPQFSWYWPVTGLLIGLGFLCKYTNALELISIVLVLALVPRLRREFGQRGIWILLACFAICTIPPIVWNAQHQWVTLGHLQSRGDLDRTPGFHPTELLAFLFAHFGTLSPLLFLGIAWAALANWRRMHQQFRVLFLMWFGLPVFALYFLLSINRAANPNWDGLAFISVAVLAVSFWREKLESRGRSRVIEMAFALALFMSAFVLDTDVMRSVGLHLWRRDPFCKMLCGWSAAAQALENVRHDVEARTGEKVFVIADERDRASEFSFYFRDKRAQGAGHPAVYIPESQAILNQFSFWPRYDEFVDAPQSAKPGEGEVYTEEQGVNVFTGRSALFIQGARKVRPPRSITAGFSSADRVAIIEVRHFGELVRQFDVFLCRNYKTLPL